MTPELQFEQHGAVRMLRLHRPDKRNALNIPLVQALLDAFQLAQADDATRVVVLAASGTSFCAGGDRAESQTLPTEDLARRNGLLATLFSTAPRMGKPVISAVRGAAVGGGAALALSCDLTLLGSSAVLSFPEIQQGIPPALVMPGLVHLVGMKEAFLLMATGDPIPSHRAVALGLANAVHDDNALEEEALALAQRLASTEPQAMGLAKQLFYGACESSLAQSLEAGRVVNDRLLAQTRRA